MINVTYNRDKNSTRVELSNLSAVREHLPIQVQFKNIITGDVEYEAHLTDNSWAEWCGAELITDVVFWSSKGNLLHHHKWDVTVDGDEIEKMLWYYIMARHTNGQMSKGLVIGSHDGRNGHWIYPVKAMFTDALLVDGSEMQFKELSKTYKNFPNVKLKNSIITTDGENVEWYTGGEGYTDTVVPDLIKSWLDESKITKTSRTSIAINDLMKDQNYDWLHLDVEGIDGDLILCLDHKPNVIIYESMNLDQLMQAKLNLWFIQNSYTAIECRGNTIAIKK